MGQCLTPFYKKDEETATHMSFPCGKCHDCLMRRVSGWSFRLIKEGQRANSALFITLTYTTETVPITPKGFMSLRKRDVQLWLKMLRKWRLHYTDMPVRYYSVGEYGTHKKRPHYHLIIFNVHSDDIIKGRSRWTHGDVHFGSVTEASIGYTLKYMCKPSQVPAHQNDDRVPEFSHMSRGLGENYITPSIIAWHEAKLTDRFYLALAEGKKIALPRYYKKRLYSESDMRTIGNAMETRIREEIDKAIEEHGGGYEAFRLDQIQARSNLLKTKRLQDKL